VLDKMAAIQMVDVQLPTTDGRTVILSRYTEPEVDQAIPLQGLKLTLPAQPPPRVLPAARSIVGMTTRAVVPTFAAPTVENQRCSRFLPSS